MVKVVRRTTAGGGCAPGRGRLCLVPCAPCILPPACTCADAGRSRDCTRTRHTQGRGGWECVACSAAEPGGGTRLLSVPGSNSIAAAVGGDDAALLILLRGLVGRHAAPPPPNAHATTGGHPISDAGHSVAPAFEGRDAVISVDIPRCEVPGFFMVGEGRDSHVPWRAWLPYSHACCAVR